MTMNSAAGLITDRGVTTWPDFSGYNSTRQKNKPLTTEPYCMVQWSETDSDTVNIVIPMNIKYHFHVTVAGKNIHKEKQNTDMPTRMLNFKK